jgi:threonine dehydratase
MYYPTVSSITQAAKLLKPILQKTPLQLNEALSKRYKTKVYLKREDLTPVRSYKLRGAYNKMSSITSKSVVSCSAGNHAQGVAFACSNLKIRGTIYMPITTPQQKISKVKQFGGTYVEVRLEGVTFDESYEYARAYSNVSNEPFVHPFDDEKVIEGQGTVGLEILEDLPNPDYVIMPVGGGGLVAGVSSYIKELSPKTKIIGAEPLGAPSMTDALNYGSPSPLDNISTFVDGASVKCVGNITFPICQRNLHDVVLINEGHVCSKILEIYNEQGLIIEPAGVLSLCVLDKLDLRSSNVVVVVSGGNSDVFRMPEILERSLIYEGLKHYFKIEFPQKPGALKDFVMNVLGPYDDIIYFRYTKIINKEMGPVIIGIQLQAKDEINRILKNMRRYNIKYEPVKDNLYI